MPDSLKAGKRKFRRTNNKLRRMECRLAQFEAELQTTQSNNRRQIREAEDNMRVKINHNAMLNRTGWYT